MPYIGNIVQDFSVNTAMLNTDSVTSIKIDDGTIVNADINDSAAIAGTKISPDFGSQAITTTNDSVTIGNSIIHSGDTDTKINFPAADTFTINTAGSERLRVDSSGRVGIGVTNPDRELDISNSSGNCTISLRGSDSHTTQLLFGDVSAELRGRVGYQSGDVLDFYTAAAERMRITSTGNVGIGSTGDSTYKTHIKSSTFGLLKLETTLTGADAPYLEFYHNSSSPADNDQLGIIQFKGKNDAAQDHTFSYILALSTDVSDGSEDGDMLFATSGGGVAAAERMRITSTGNVGIGTTSPANVTNYTSLSINHATSGGFIGLEKNGTRKGALYLDASTADFIIQSESGESLQFCTNGSNERMRLFNNGKLALGLGAIAEPKGTAGGSFDLSNGNITMCIGGDNGQNGSRTNSTDKLFRITGPHYTNAEEPFGVVIGFCGSSDSRILYGGGSTLVNAVTEHRFFTAADATTISGTEKLRIDSSGRLLVGHSSARQIAGGNSKIQVESNDSTGRISIVQNRNEASGAPFLSLGKSRGTSVGSSTVVQSGDTVGTVAFAGSDGTDFPSVAQIVGQVDGTPGNNDMPGRLVFRTCPDGSDSTSERLRIDSSGDVLINRTTSINVASTATSKLQVHHGSGNISAAFYSTADHIGPAGVLALGHARGSDSGVLQDNDLLGQIRFAGGDGNDLATIGASIDAEVNGTPSGNAMPTDLVFFTNNGSSSTGERMRLLKSGGLTFNGDTATANALDDYEEGDWTPGLSQGSPTINTQVGKYTKIGELVLCSFYIDFTNGGTSTSQRITGLPFTPNSTREGVLSVSRLGSAFDEDESGGNRTMGAVSHTSQGTTRLYVDKLIGNATAGIRGTFMYRAA